MNPKSILLTLITVAALGVGGWNLKNLFSSSDAGARSADRWFVCSETKKGFQVTLKDGMKIPVLSPFSGKNTGYPAEKCYWTADGKIKEEPTYVLMNAWLGSNAPTFCQDCGRLVVQHNAQPNPGSKPPPTKAEYEARRNPERADR